MIRKKIVILGAGYGGLRALKKLQALHPDADLVLINKNDYHCETTALHEVAAGTTEASAICYSVDDVVDLRQTDFIQDTVLSIDRGNHRVLLKEHPPVSYDYLLIALGFESETFGIQGIQQYALAIADIPSGEQIRRHIESEFADWKEDHDDRHLTLIVGGAGFTSFEFLGELTDHLPELAEKDRVDLEKARVVCIEPTPKVLPMFDQKLGRYATERLRKRGVEFIVGRVSRVAANEVYYKADSLEHSLQAGTFVWTGGVRGSSVIEASGFKQRRDRVAVNKDLSVPGNPEILIIGDCSELTNPATGKPYPATAQIALEQANTAACNLNALACGKAPVSFEYRFKGTVCSLGKRDALGEVMGQKIKGYPAALMKKIIDNRSIAKIGGIETMLKKGRFSIGK